MNIFHILSLVFLVLGCILFSIAIYLVWLAFIDLIKILLTELKKESKQLPQNINTLDTRNLDDTFFS